MDAFAAYEPAMPETRPHESSEFDGRADGTEHSSGTDNKFQQAISSWRSKYQRNSVARKLTFQA